MVDDRQRKFQVVVNDDEQYSMWPVDEETPVGWRPVGPVGSKADCLAYIDEVWTDMRPLTLRRHFDGRTSSIRPPDTPDATAG